MCPVDDFQSPAACNKRAKVLGYIPEHSDSSSDVYSVPYKPRPASFPVSFYINILHEEVSMTSVAGWQFDQTIFISSIYQTWNLGIQIYIYVCRFKLLLALVQVSS